MIDAGFVFWGLFVVFGLFVAAYLIWMWRTERPERKERASRNGAKD